MDVALKQGLLERLRGTEADVVGGEDGFELGRDVDVDTGADELKAGVDEVRLPFVLAASQVRDQAPPLHEVDTGAGQLDAEAVEEAEAAAGE